MKKWRIIFKRSTFVKITRKMASSYRDLFLCFSKVGAFTIGGGYAMIAVIEDEVVKKRKWIDSEEFMDAVTIAQSSPGLLAVNISIFLGYKLKGTKGSIVATLGSITPPFLIILAVALFFTHFQDNEAVIKIFKGIRPAVVALIAIPVINMAKKAKLSKIRLAMAIATAILIIFAKVSPVYIMLAVFVYYFYTIGADIIHHHNKKGGER